MKDHQYKKQDWEKPHVIVFGQFPPYPETPYGMKQSHNHYHYSLFGSQSPVATKLIGQGEKESGIPQQHNLVQEIQRSENYSQFDHDFGNIRKVEYVRVEKQEVVQRVIQKVERFAQYFMLQVQVVQNQRENVGTIDKFTQSSQETQLTNTLIVQKDQIAQQKELELQKDIIIEQTNDKQSIEQVPNQQDKENINFPDFSKFNPLNFALEWRYTGMLSFSFVSFALFRHRNFFPPLVSIFKIRNAAYATSSLSLLFSIPFFPQIKSIFSNQYCFIKRRLKRRNQNSHQKGKCRWNTNKRRKKYQPPEQLTFLSNGEYYSNY